jgi:hypothetical protein
VPRRTSIKIMAYLPFNRSRVNVEERDDRVSLRRAR